MTRIIYSNGTKFGQLTVVDKAPNGKDNRPTYNCLCSCGNSKKVSARNLQRGATTHCGCNKSIRPIRNPDAALDSLIRVYKGNAKKKRLPCELTKEEFIKLFNGNCYYCNEEPSKVYKKAKIRYQYIYNGIDRIRNSEGYINDNTVSCCKSCNYMKSSQTQEDFLRRIFNISKNLSLIKLEP